MNTNLLTMCKRRKIVSRRTFLFRKTLYSKVKQNYLNLLWATVNTDREKIAEVIYELIRHVRARRISLEDIQQLIETSRMK